MEIKCCTVGLRPELRWPVFYLRNRDQVLHFGAHNETKCCVLGGLKNGFMGLLLELRNGDQVLCFGACAEAGGSL